ncbi:uncharacterized protein LOC132701271 isoform X1 [Cylas formicarius]|uniref:uncharacterized protein LOC132701271 isoform X1 n=1 Tax=Cylas formicarius TaxID=197179 RepID=UPI00295836AB|nr:uncharacterized protein LOC132701271 isoform X1 [Cylas formicarius]
MKSSALAVILVSFIASTTIAFGCAYESNPDYFNCTEVGHFPNLNDPTCTTYFCCSERDDQFIKELKTCVVDTYFNEDTGGCDYLYQCPCREAETKKSTDCVVDSSAQFTCTEPGCFPNPADPYCKSYISCYAAKSGKIYKSTYSCPYGTFFDSAGGAGGCSIVNNCPCQENA